MATPQAAHLGTIAIGGAPQAIANSPTTKLTANTRYQLAPSQRRLDPNVALTVEVDADGAGAGGYVVADPSTYDVDYCFGVITFKADQGANALVRVSGRYIQALPLANVRTASFNVANDIVELALLGDGYKRRVATLRDLSGELTLVDLANADQDPGAGITTLQAYFDAGTAFFLDIGEGTGQALRAWIRITELASKLTPGGLYELSVKYVGHSFPGVGQTEYVVWGYGTP